MHRAPTIVDLVSSSSEEDDHFPVHANPQYKKSYQLDEPMEIEEDEPFEHVKSNDGMIGCALESVLYDLESEEDEAFENQTEDENVFQTEKNELAVEMKECDSNWNASRTVVIEEPSAHQVILRSKYQGHDREEGELSDDPNIADDELWQQKQLEATYLREVQVAQRKANLQRIAKSTIQTPPRKKRGKKLKRKLHDASTHLPPLNMGYPRGRTSPLQKTHLVAPESILRFHRHVVMEKNENPSYMASDLPNCPPLPPPVLIPPPLPAKLSLVPCTISSESTEVLSVSPEVDDTHVDLESLRNAVKQSVKKLKPISSLQVKSIPNTITTSDTTEQLKVISTTPTPLPSPLSSTRLSLGPNNKWNNPSISMKKPLTACTQRLVINLSLKDCEEMRKRHQLVQLSLEEKDPIVALKQKIALREEELRNKQKSTDSNEIPSQSDRIILAQSHVNRLEKRINELKELIALKEKKNIQ